MPRSLYPPRNVNAPALIVYDATIPIAIRMTYILILGLAYARTETPVLSFQQLSNDWKISISTLRSHMAFLRDRGVLRWRTAQDGTIIVSFPKGASKGQAFFTDKNPDSENLEKPVKEEEVINSTRKELEHHHPPDSVKKGAKNQKERHFSATVHQALLEAGVFESKLPELAQAGLSDGEIMAIIHKVEDEFRGELKGGILVHRIEKKIIPPKVYFGVPCTICGKYGSHTSSCRQGMREKYLCSGCDMADCICDDVDEVSLSTSAAPSSDSANIWQIILSRLQMDMPRASYDAWLRETKPLRLDGSILVVGVPNYSTLDLLESRLSSKISKLLIGILNTADTGVKFVVTE